MTNEAQDDDATDENEIAELIADLSEVQATFDALRPDASRARAKGAPAATEAIDALEARFGHPLPKSYREFLSLHDGWRELSPGAHLLSTSEQSASWVLARVAAFTEAWPKGTTNPFAHGALPIMFGEAIDHFVVLDPTRRAGSGEPCFVEYEEMKELTSYAELEDLFVSELDAYLGAIERLTAGAASPGAPGPKK